MSERRLLDALVAARTGAGPGVELADEAYPREAALRLQLSALAELERRGETLAGWKASFSSGASHDRMGPGFRPFGYILESHVFGSDAEVPLPADGDFAIEPEICLILGDRLEGPVDADAARLAVAGAAPAFELNQSRLPRPSSDASTLADGMGQWGIVVGTPVAVELDVTTVTVELKRDGELAVRSEAPAAIDDPALSLARVANVLAEFGLALEPGQRVITGSFSRAPITTPSSWSATFTGLGEVRVRFAEAAARPA